MRSYSSDYGGIGYRGPSLRFTVALTGICPVEIKCGDRAHLAAAAEAG